MAELNGAPVKPEDLQTLALINYGHFTSMRVEGGTVQGLSLHLERLTRDCRALFDADLDIDRVRKFVRQAVGRNTDDVATVRVTVFDPDLEMGHPGAQARPQVLVTFRAASASGPLPAWRVQSARYSRESPSVKHIGLCGTIGLRRNAQLDGFDDVLFVEADGSISEGATWNVGFFDGQNVVWPAAPCLDGVTMQLLKHAHADTEIRTVGVDGLSEMRAAFATNAAIGVRAIALIDGVEFDGDHPIIAALQAEYLGVIPETL